MSRKFLACASALSLAVMLAACGGDDDSTPLADTESDKPQATEDENTDSSPDTGQDNPGTTATPVVLGVYDGQSFSESTIKRLDGNDTPVAASGSATFRVNIYNTKTNMLAIGDEFEVSFNSGCVTSGTASLSRESVLTSSGTAETTFKANGCSGQDQIKATIPGVTGAEAFVTIRITEAKIVDIVSSAPNPASIAPTDGSPDDRASTSSIDFTVLGEGGAPISQKKTVKLNIIPSNSSASLINAEVETGENGTVRADVQAGEANEVIRVVATVMDNDSAKASTTSAPIAINSKLAVQSRFSLSLDNFSINARNIDGVEINASILAADQYGNAIRGNTVVNFSASEGSITPDCELDSEGKCSVLWRSLGAEELRPTIYAYTQGEKIVSGENCYNQENECTLEPARIKDSEQFVQSSSRGVKATIVDKDDGSYCADVYTELKNGQGITTKVIPPSGTQIEFTATGATFVNPDAATGPVPSDPNIVGDTSYDEICVEPEEGEASETPRLKLTVTPPDGTVVTDSLKLTFPP